MSQRDDIKDTADPSEWLTIDEAAEEVGIAARTIRKYLSQPSWSSSARSEQRETRSGWRMTRLVTRETARRMAKAARYIEREPVASAELGHEVEQEEGKRRHVVAVLEVDLYG